MFREIAFGVVLLIAAAFVVVGVAHYSPGLAWVAAGVLLALVGWLVLADDAAPATGDAGPDEVTL